MLPTLIMSIISGEAADAAARARRAAIVYGVAAVLLFTGLGFLIGAGYIATARQFGNLEAALLFAGGFVVVAIVLIVGQRILSKARARRISARRRREVTGIAGAAALALLPTLLSRKGALPALAIPVIAAIAYTIWRENKGPGSDKPE